MATNNVINGTKFGVYAAGTKIAYATSASISMNHNLRDTSTKDSGGWRDQLEGQRDWEVSVEGMLIFVDGSVGAIAIKLMVDGDDMSFRQYDGTEVLEWIFLRNRIFNSGYCIIV